MCDRRPSDRELSKRIDQAKEALKERHGLFANPSKVVGELNALAIGNSNEIWSIIKDLLEEVSPSDYIGTRPPQKSYEKTIVGLELFAFCWVSRKMGKKMYIKFALKNGHYVYVSLHETRDKEMNK